MKYRILILCLIMGTGVWSQKSAYQFSIVKDHAHGKVEDQCQTGTCWSFATTSFMESEILRISKIQVDLSEMAHVRYNYPKKVESYVLYQGKQQLGPGGLGHDVLNSIRGMGLIPEAAYSGFVGGEQTYNHQVLDTYMETIAKMVVDKKLNESGSAWKKGVESTLNEYLGVMPTAFEFAEKKYTPASFAAYCQINPDDYVCLTSFSHHPYYSSFAIEVPDNWSKGYYWNLPLEEFTQVAQQALQKGYTIAWDADVSEVGFSYKNGAAILPVETLKREEVYTQLREERKVTQESRQEEFESWETTDDHLMHITGISQDQQGRTYFVTKNSWGEKNEFGGFQHVSIPYFQAKTICIIVHKDAIPAEIMKKIKR